MNQVTLLDHETPNGPWNGPWKVDFRGSCNFNSKPWIYTFMASSLLMWVGDVEGNKILGQHKSFISKKFWVQKVLGLKNFGSKITFSPTKFWVQQNFRLDLSELTNRNLTWPMIMWLDLPQLDLTCPYLNWLDPNWLDLSWLDLTSPDLTYPDMNCSNLTCPDFSVLNSPIWLDLS